MRYRHIPIFPSPSVRPYFFYRNSADKSLFQNTHPLILGRVYRTKAGHPPQSVRIIAQDNGVRRYVCVDGILGGWFQPKVHGAEATIIDRSGHFHRFYIFFKNHVRLRMNQTIAHLCHGRLWRGNAAIFRVAAAGSKLVNLRAGDNRLADFALKWYVI